MTKVILSAIAVSLLAYSGASALPAPSGEQLVAPSDLVQVAKKKGGKWNRGGKYGKWDRGPRYGHGYNSPRSYRHRYSYRPYDWHDRGCINIGPVWYCS